MTTKEKILQVALTLFVQQGVDKTSTRQITESVGLSEGALFVHFKNKQTLIDTLYIDSKKSLLNVLKKDFDENENTETNIKNIVQKIASFYIANYELFLFHQLVNTGNNVSKNILEEGQKEFYTIFNCIENGIKNKKIKNLHTDLVKSIIWANLSTLIIFCKKQNLKKLSAEQIEVIWDSIKI